MRRFRYGADGLGVLACAAYALNRWLLPASWQGPFLRNHFNDLLLIPAALPRLLGVQRRLGTRAHDEPPRLGEIGLALALWSVIAEVVMPRITARAVADPWDVAAYAAGAVVSFCWWRRP